MDIALKIITALNLATPGIAEMILIIRKKDGTITVTALLDEAEATFDQNIAKAKEWLQNHPKANA